MSLFDDQRSPFEGSGRHNLKFSRISRPRRDRHEHMPITKIAKRILLVFLFGVFVSGGFFGWKVYSVSKQMASHEPLIVQNTELPRSQSASIEPEAPAVDLSDKGRINILLLGRAGKNKPGANLTDTIMVASVDRTQKKVALLSLPRDLYVNIPDTNLYTKINSVYQHGLSQKTGATPIIKTVESIIGQNIDYYVVLDFEGFVGVVDAVGGVNVTVERDVFDARYPGPNYSYETFELSKGLQKMDGTTALKYVRYRHGDPEGDFGRAKRQQQVMQAVKNKVFTLRTFLNPFTVNELLETLAANVRTNITPADIDDFIVLLKDVDTQNITTVVVDAWKKDSLLRVAHFYHGDIRAFGLVPRSGNYGDIQERAENIFDLAELERRKENIVQEDVPIVLINHSGSSLLAQKVRTYLKNDLGFQTVTMRGGGAPIITQSLVFDGTGGQNFFSLDALLRKVPAERVTTENNLKKIIPAFAQKTTGKIFVFLGTDVIDAYIYEEATIEELNSTPLDQQYLDVIEKENS